MTPHLLIKRAAVLVAAATLGSTSAMAAPGGALNAIRDRIHQHLTGLNITADQREQIRGVLRDFMPEVAPLVKQSLQEHRALTAVIRATPVNEADIRAQAAKVAAVDADLAVKRALIEAKIRPILTPDQIQQILQLEDAFHSALAEGLGRLANWIEGK